MPRNINLPEDKVNHSPMKVKLEVSTPDVKVNFRFFLVFFMHFNSSNLKIQSLIHYFTHLFVKSFLLSLSPYIFHCYTTEVIDQMSMSSLFIFDLIRLSRLEKHLFLAQSINFLLLFSNILTFPNFMVVVCNRTLNDIDQLNNLIRRRRRVDRLM